MILAYMVVLFSSVASVKKRIRRKKLLTLTQETFQRVTTNLNLRAKLKRVFGGWGIRNDHIVLLQLLFIITRRVLALVFWEVGQRETTISGATNTSLLPNKIRSFTFYNTSNYCDPCSVSFKQNNTYSLYIYQNSRTILDCSRRFANLFCNL